MIRAPMGNQAYWDKWYRYSIDILKKQLAIISTPSGNPIYESQYIFDLTINYLRLMLTEYSCGQPIGEMGKSFEGLLDAWELSNKLATEICEEHHLKKCRDWTFDLANLNHYNWCFWLVGLAIVLDIPDEAWRRLLALVETQGKDILLDSIIASREPKWQIGAILLHRKPYARLKKAIDAPKEKQAVLLREFVDHWYAELARKGKEELWWHVFCDFDKHPLKSGSYFGCWCIEAVAAVKAFGLDDSLCLGNEHYPGDLLRPDQPSTHTASENNAAEPQSEKSEVDHQPGILSRFLKKIMK